MEDQAELFGASTRRVFDLSALLNTPDHQDQGCLVKWGKINKREMCDECLARQHETHGQWGGRSPARTTRTVRGVVLNLCHAHAEAWKSRDRGE